MIHTWQDQIYEVHGIHFIHAGDEWYILAGEELPREERYDGYLQLENGVGMLRLLMDEFGAGAGAHQRGRQEERAVICNRAACLPLFGAYAGQTKREVS